MAVGLVIYQHCGIAVTSTLDISVQADNLKLSCQMALRIGQWSQELGAKGTQAVMREYHRALEVAER